MRMSNKKYFRKLLMSTALTAVPLFFPESAQAVDVDITGIKWVSTLDGGWSDGIVDDRTYVMSSGTTDGTITSIAGFKDQALFGDYTQTYSSGIYQISGGGINIGASNPNQPPTFDFTAGGVIWDASSYSDAFSDNQSATVRMGTLSFTVRNETIGGNIVIGNGIFNGRIKIIKGAPYDHITTVSTDEGPASYTGYAISSSGNIDIAGGRFYFSQDSDIQTYANNIGSILIRGDAQLNVGYTDDATPVDPGINVTIANHRDGGAIEITGGHFNIAEDSTLTLSGANASGALSNPTYKFEISGDGNLQLSMKTFSINSPITWTTGTITQTMGTLNINSQVTLKRYDMQGQSSSLVISGRLSIENNVRFAGTLSGSGELVLSDTANAEFGRLNEFGTISVRSGKASFVIAGPSGNKSLSVLNGATGNEDQIGIVYIASTQNIGTVNLGKAALVLNEELVVDTLNIGAGQIIFAAHDNKPLTLTKDTTIYNTDRIVTTGTVRLYYKNAPNQQYGDLYEDVEAKPGTVTIKDGLTLTFADVENPVSYFNSGNLTLNVENNATALFDSNSVTLKKLSMTTGTAEVKKGTLHLDSAEIGNNSAIAGTLTVDAGATMTVDTALTANKGTTIVVNGTLNTAGVDAKGTPDLWATLTGTGTVNVTGDSLFQGRINELAVLTVDGDGVNATFSGNTGYSDMIGRMTVKNGGTAILQNGTLTLDSLSLNHGTINLNGENAVLALKQNPVETLSGEGNSIFGRGTLELLNNTGITFGGNNGAVGYLGGLKIGTGTVVISDDLTLGSVKFSSDRGGRLEIAADKTLTLSDEGGGCTRADHCSVRAQNGNVISGTGGSIAGTLYLVDGDGSVFGGLVNLNTLVFGKENGKMTFGYAGRSTVQNFTVHDGGAEVVVNNGTLVVGNGFNGIGSGTAVQTTVYGTGTLSLLGTASVQNTGTQSLAALNIGASGDVTGSGSFGKIMFASGTGGTFHADDATVTQMITVGTGNAIDGAGLTLSGLNTAGNFYSALTDLDSLTVKGNAIAYVNVDTGVGAEAVGLNLMNGTVSVAAGKTLTAKNETLGTADSVITGGGTLHLNRTGAQTVNAALDGLNALRIDGTVTMRNTASVQNVTLDGTASFKQAATIGNMTMTGTATFERNATVGSMTVDGTATFEQSATVNDVTLSADSTMNLAGGTVGNARIATGSTMNFGGEELGTVALSGTLNVQNNASAGTVTLSDAGTLDIAAGKTLSVSRNISVGADSVLSGTGTVFLSGTATGRFAMNTDFHGAIKIGAGSANIATSASIGSVFFADDKGGVLNIENDNTLTVGRIVTAGQNRITGVGALKLNGEGLNSEFGAPIDHLGELIVTNTATAAFKNTINIARLTFENGGGNVNIAQGTMTLNEIAQNDLAHIGTVYGEGALIAGAGAVNLSTGEDHKLASATIGTGTMNFIGNSHIGSLKYSSAEGTINIQNNVTVKVYSDFSGIGRLNGAENASLQLMGSAGATFNKANDYQGTISAETGSLTFLTDMDFKALNLNGTTVKFDRKAKIDSFSMSTGNVAFNQQADVEAMEISSTGSVLFKDTANLGSLNAGSGSVTFSKDAELANGSVTAGGSLNIGVNKLTFNVGDFSFYNNSALSLRISRAATDEEGNVNETGYGRMVMNGGTLNIGNNVNLNMTIEYGLKTAEGGTVFKLVEGTKTGYFSFKNNRYSLTEETCEGGVGICYRLKQSSTAGQYTQEATGNSNQVGVAQAFLDGKLFDPGTKLFTIAERLDNLSQNASSKTFLNALTALAPDVTNAMSRQPIALQAKISDTLSARMNGLSGSLGTNTPTFRNRQQYFGRSGGSPYKTRYMRASDYYRNAGYYDDPKPAVQRPRPEKYQRHVDQAYPENMETTQSRQRWAKRDVPRSTAKNFGMWAQAFYNKASYSSTDKPDGFSGDTTGIAFGADTQIFDVIALGIGYASTSSSVDSLQRSTDVKGGSLFLYGMYKPSDWFVSSVLNVTAMKYTEKKNISGINVNDKYDGSSVGGTLMIGKDLHSWTPAVGVRYVSSKRDAHQDEIGQNIAAISTNVTTLVAEGRMNRDFAKTETSEWHGELSAALTYDISAAGEDAVVNLPNGSSYTVKGDDFESFGAELGASLSWTYGDHVDVTAGYNLEWRSDYMSHTLMATFRYSF